MSGQVRGQGLRYKAMPMPGEHIPEACALWLGGTENLDLIH